MGLTIASAAKCFATSPQDLHFDITHISPLSAM